MAFKSRTFKIVLGSILMLMAAAGLCIWAASFKAEASQEAQDPLLPAVQIKTLEPSPKASSEEESVIEKQFEEDRQQQKQTKYLKNKLEQTNLELEQEKALAEINKLKTENGSAFTAQAGGQSEFPEVKLAYIGGSDADKEAVLSIAGVNYRVKAKSMPLDNVQVTAISDTDVTLQFFKPRPTAKTITFKPE